MPHNPNITLSMLLSVSNSVRGCRRTQRPLPEPAGQLSRQRALQFPEASEECFIAHHAPTTSLLLYSLPSFPLYAVFRRSTTGRDLAGRDFREYYDGSVPFLLAQGGASRIFTYPTSLAHCRCRFASLNEVIPHRFPKRAFHWSHAPQCISRPY